MNLPLDENIVSLKIDENNLPLDEDNISKSINNDKILLINTIVKCEKSPQGSKTLIYRLDNVDKCFNDIREKDDEEINRIKENVIKIVKQNDSLTTRIVYLEKEVNRLENIIASKEGNKTYLYYKNNGMIDKIIELKKQGLSYQKITNELNELNYKQKNEDKPITKSIVQKIIDKYF
jgi:hypothetical protein